MRTSATLALAAVLFGTPATPAQESAAVKHLEAMTPDDFQARVTLKDDALETSATLTTEDGFREKRGLLGLVPFDVYLRAFVDKANGHVRYQVYTVARHRGTHYDDWTVVNYATPSGPRSIAMDDLGKDTRRCSRLLGCERIEVQAFPVDEAVLRAQAARYVAGALTPWPFKVKGRMGEERLECLSAAEIAGLLKAVDEYRVKHHWDK